MAATGSLIGSKSTASGQAAIDRRKLVDRHCPVLRNLDALSPLSLGNGEFAFTADITGLQTFPQAYLDGTPLCTMSQWGWHTTPARQHSALLRCGSRTLKRTGGLLDTPVNSAGQSELFNWLRENPHRLHLGRIALSPADGGEFAPGDVTSIEQRLDLWSGRLISRFELRGRPVTVKTAVHPREDVLAVEVESSLIAEARLMVTLNFPYGSPAMEAADWQAADKHSSRVIAERRNRIEIERRLDRDLYFVTVQGDGSVEVKSTGPHTFRLGIERWVVAAVGGFRIRQRASCNGFDNAANIPGMRAHWQRFWSTGGAIELARARTRERPNSSDALFFLNI
jgi:hypothetical protein